MERRLAAILAADVVSYSRLMGEDEEGTLAALRQFRAEQFNPSVIDNHGNIIKSMGDGWLVEFSSAADAIKCAFQVQEILTGAEIIKLRIGIHIGDIMHADEDIFGDGVNIASRLQELASPGGIIVSDMVRRSVDGKLATRFSSLGAWELKNIAEPVTAFAWGSATSLGTAASNDAAIPLPDKPSIAVLPLDNMSGDPDQEYFSDGITEDIITELSRFPSLFVIARNSSFSYKGKSVDVRQIAQELGVRYVLEGSIRRAGNRVRISAQLIDRESGSHIWAERYDRDLEDIFDLQEEITRNVVASIAPQIEMAEIARARGGKGTKFSSYDLALKAQALWYDGERMGSPDVLQQAINVTKDSLKQDPRNVHAMWTQTMAYFVQYLYRWGPAPDEALDHSWAAVERMLEIDSSDPRGYAARGVVHHFRGEHNEAVADYRRAFALNPNFAMNIFMMAWCESMTGFTEQSREHVALGLRLSPRDNEIWLGVAYLALAQASFADGDFEQTKKWGELAIQIHPKAPIRRALMIACYGHAGDLDEAAKQVADLTAFAPDFLLSILHGDMTIYKMPEHNALLSDGLRKAGLDV